MNNTKSTNASKVRKANKKFVATICAVITATAMITGVAVFNASASDAVEAPTKPISTIVTVANENAQKTAKADNKADDTKAAFSSEIKLEPKAEINTEAAQKSTDAVKHPGESGYYYAANQNLFSKDRFVSSDGSRAAMEVTYAGNNSYVCTIRMANSYNNEFVYSFKGVVRGPEIDYTQGAKFDVTYDDNGNIIKNVKIGSDHSGTIERSRAGAFVWINSDETHVTFIPAQD